MELDNKVCIIAGASGAIGCAVAKRFYAEGARLALTYLHEPGACLSFARKPNRDRFLEMQLDVRKWQHVQDVVQTISRHFGTIDALVNCTGVLGPVGPTATVSHEEWAWTVETNLIGSFYLTRAVLDVMLARGAGSITHFSGGGAAYGRPFFTAYGASKAALVRFTESLADEVRERNIRVNAIAPGPVMSRMWEQLRSAGGLGGADSLQELEKMDETGGVSADRAAALALFLASERSQGLTGRLISAIHDSWETFEHRIPDIMQTEAGTLRRVPWSKPC